MAPGPSRKGKQEWQQSHFKGPFGLTRPRGVWDIMQESEGMGGVSRLYSPFHVVVLAKVNHFVGSCLVPLAERL